VVIGDRVPCLHVTLSMGDRILDRTYLALAWLYPKVDTVCAAKSKYYHTTWPLLHFPLLIHHSFTYLEPVRLVLTLLLSYHLSTRPGSAWSFLSQDEWL
jgi:hypothetical protein